MLTGKNVVLIKDQAPIVYDRIYLENAQSDPTETYPKTQNGKPVQIDGKEFQAVRPTAASTVNPETLVQEAIAWFQQTYPGTTEKPSNPWVTLLEAASYGADLWKRNELQGISRPKQPKSEEKAKADILKNLLAAGMAKNLEDAEVMYNRMTAAA